MPTRNLQSGDRLYIDRSLSSVHGWKLLPKLRPLSCLRGMRCWLLLPCWLEIANSICLCVPSGFEVPGWLYCCGLVPSWYLSTSAELSSVP